MALTIAIITQSVMLMVMPVSAWSWDTDGRCEVPTYEASVVNDSSIKVDAELDEGYIGGTKIISYPDSEPYRRSKYNDVWDDARGNFEAYIAADTKGLYVYAEIEDITIFDSMNSYGNDGDYFQIYLDWVPDSLKHPSPEEMYYMKNKGNPWNYANYKNSYKTDGEQYLGWVSGDYNGNISCSMGFSGIQTIQYASAIFNGGWACEWFIPWRDSSQIAAVKNRNSFHCGIAFQAGDDSDINDTVTPGVEQDVGICYDQRKETGLSYYADYSRLADVSFVEACAHKWNIINEKAPACTANGYRYKVCNECKVEYTELLSALGHDLKTYICTESAKKDVICTRCDKTLSSGMNVTVAPGSEESHVFRKTSDYKDPTCTESGLVSVECKYCDETKEEEAPVLPHSFRYIKNSKRYICDGCGKNSPHGDVNLDGSVTNADVLMIYRYIYDPNTYPVPDFEISDVNCDEKITNADVLEIYRYIYDPSKYPINKKIAALEVGGNEITDYIIIYPSSNENGEKKLAEKLASHFLNNFGAEIKVSTSWTNASKAIVIGNTSTYITDSIRNSAKKYSTFKMDTINSSIVTVGNVLWIAASNKYTAEAAIDKLIDITTPVADEEIKLSFSTAQTLVSVKATSLGEELKVMSYNVQTGTPTTDRVNSMIGNITSFMPDVLGTQEVNYKWIGHFKDKGLLDEYTMVGKPRGQENDTSNGNEYSAILYRTSKFNLIDSGTYWLSDTPTVVGSMHPSSDYIRIMTYAVLERKSDGVRFLHVNTHLEWDHGEVKTNLIQINIMLDLVNSKVYSKYGELPTFFTGDFNVNEKSEGYAQMYATGHSDSRYVADKTTNEDTFSGGSQIDFCFVSNEDFLVSEFDVGHGLAGSDHYPVYIRMYLTPNK